MQPPTPPPSSPVTATPLLRFEAVTRRYGEVAAVDNLSLDVAAGEFFALLGPSGCGKTTLLRLVAGFEEPEAGRVLLDSQDLAGISPHRRPVNMMFQSYALFPHMTVAGNIAFGLRQDRLPQADIAVRVAEMLSLVQLDGLADRRPDQLSGGQRQRVALARALVKRPKVLLLDEPMAALDKRLRAETQAELTALQRRLGTTFVIVTHDQEEAMSLATRLAVMERGRILQVGKPADVYERPASRAVATFLGEINTIEGVVARADAGGIQIDCGAIGYFRAESRDGLTTGSQVALALRPEKIRITAERPSDPNLNSVTGTIESIGYFGDSSVYRVCVERERAPLKVSMQNAMRAGERAFAVGETVWLAWGPQSAVVLDS